MHIGGHRTDAIVVDQFLADEEPAPGGQTLEDALQQEFDFVFGPIVENTAEVEEIGGGEFVREEVAGRDFDARGYR